MLSARLSPSAIHHLMRETSSKSLIASPRLHSVAKDALKLFEDEKLSPGLYSPKPHRALLERSRKRETKSICARWHYVDPYHRDVIILHSSGTTGLPKPIPQSHGYALCFAFCHDFRGPEEAHALNVSTVPLFHVCIPQPLFQYLLTVRRHLDSLHQDIRWPQGKLSASLYLQ